MPIVVPMRPGPRTLPSSSAENTSPAEPPVTSTSSADRTSAAPMHST